MRRVLVFDDNADVRAMMSMMVEAAGYTALSAQSAVEALECLQRESARIAVVVTDLHAIWPSRV
jgi:CheY-like chemotaxis protein